MPSGTHRRRGRPCFRPRLHHLGIVKYRALTLRAHRKPGSGSLLDNSNGGGDFGDVGVCVFKTERCDLDDCIGVSMPLSRGRLGSLSYACGDTQTKRAARLRPPSRGELPQADDCERRTYPIALSNFHHSHRYILRCVRHEKNCDWIKTLVIHSTGPLLGNTRCYVDAFVFFARIFRQRAQPGVHLTDLQRIIRFGCSGESNV